LRWINELVWTNGIDKGVQEKQEASGAIGEGKHSRAQTASTTVVAPLTGQVVGDEADVITNTRSTHDATEATQTTDKAAPGASGVKSTSVLNEVDTAPTQETTPAKAVSEHELGEDPAPRRPPADDSASPPVPEKDTAVYQQTCPHLRGDIHFSLTNRRASSHES
jgi:hypothetical protein